MLLRLSSLLGIVGSLALSGCSGEEKEGACAGSYLYRDADGDGFGDPAATLDGCAARAGYVSNESDCDDADAAAYPGADERCDGADDDCDGAVDEDALDQTPIYADADGDGFGDAASPTYVCDVPTDAIVDGSDCDDGDADISPAADETCDGVDQDCDGAVDDDAIDPLTWHADADGDGFGDAGATTLACAAPEGFVANGADCDDTYAAAFPGADENCDGHDEDCDGEVDEGATDPGTWYPDRDADGFGDAADSTFACTPPDGWVRDAADCDDTSADVFPGAEERWDGLDGDCDGAVDEDAI
ncbi:MAG: putative metal-binding motif-containing protein, partial [Myxococcota bacterium]